MIEFDNRTDLALQTDLLERIADLLTKKDIELVVVNGDEMREINRESRNIDKDTDVLSFPYEDVPMGLLGSIVISSFYLQERAEEFTHTQNDEFTLLFIHGILHLLGYDHEIDSGEMRLKEIELIEEFSLPKSLIVRSQE